MWYGWRKQRLCEACGRKHKAPVRFCEQCGRLVASPPELYPTERRQKQLPRPCEPAYTPEDQDERLDGEVLPCPSAS